VTRYLIDTDAISAAAPATAVKRAELIDWMDSAFVGPFPVGGDHFRDR
jgi:hypothetical protein